MRRAGFCAAGGFGGCVGVVVVVGAAGAAGGLGSAIFADGRRYAACSDRDWVSQAREVARLVGVLLDVGAVTESSTSSASPNWTAELQKKSWMPISLLLSELIGIPPQPGPARGGGGEAAPALCRSASKKEIGPLDALFTTKMSSQCGSKGHGLAVE